jgi:rhodanese-related sulfurtransferase
MNGTAEPATRGVAAILVFGALLGFAFNYLSRLNGPGRGLPWIAEDKQLPKLEDLLASGTGRSVAPGPPVQTQDPVPPAGALSAPSSATTPPMDRAPATAVDREPSRSAAGPVEPPASGPSTARSTPPASIADPDDPLGGMLASQGEGLPEIPDLDRPFAVEMGLVKRLFDAQAAYFIDARDVEEFDEGHIPGSVNLPFSTAGTDPERLERIEAGEKPIVIYCGGGTCEVSMSLAETLVYQYAKRKVLVYMGGFPEWQAAGYPVARGGSHGGNS